MLAVCWPPKDGREESQRQRRNSLPMLSPEDISSCLVFAVDNLCVFDCCLLEISFFLPWRRAWSGWRRDIGGSSCTSPTWPVEVVFLKKTNTKNTFMETVIHISQMDQWTTCSGEKYRNQSQKPQMTQVAMRLRATIKAIQSRWNSLPGPKAGYTWTMMVACGGRFYDRVR